ncbi:DUF3455 domain-containing protein [Actinoplanes sp. NPDC089786]|uniref:DUF3455 domain-containing protein n=1 Tax=Actinoplanes sp. NPDC089786 TaxID=3155185 RepID=UPI0034231B29
MSKRRNIRAVSIIGAAAVAVAASAVTLSASAATPIDPPAGSTKVGEWAVATGIQTYTCANGTFVGTASVPEALLVDAAQQSPLHHFAGPSWQSNVDGSTVTATKTAESPKAGTIPELLLTVNSHSGPDGILTPVKYIQRLNTSGGAAPTRPCTTGDRESVPYGATYVMFK